MKYREIYTILDEQREKHSGFCVMDRSNWKKPIQNIVDHMIPLWIIVEDKNINKRIWITEESRQLQITTAQLNLDPKSRAYSESHVYRRFVTQKAMAGYLRTLFMQINDEGGKTA